MSIQANVNQMLSVAGMLLTTNPSVRARVERKNELNRLNRELSAVQKGADIEGKVTFNAEFPEEYKKAKEAGFSDEPTVITSKDGKSVRMTSNAAGYAARVAVDKAKESALPYYEEGLKLEQQRFKLDPTVENLRDLRQTEEGIASIKERMRMRAEAATRAAQDERRSGRRKFSDYLADEPTNLGGKVIDLPKNMQQEIAKQYTKSQRKALMDRKDLDNG